VSIHTTVCHENCFNKTVVTAHKLVTYVSTDVNKDWLERSRSSPWPSRSRLL